MVWSHSSDKLLVWKFALPRSTTNLVGLKWKNMKRYNRENGELLINIVQQKFKEFLSTIILLFK